MIFGAHRTTAEQKYLRIALERGGFIRRGRCGIFRDQRAVIDYDLRRYSSSQVTDFQRCRCWRKARYGLWSIQNEHQQGEPTSNIDKRALREWLRGLRRGNWRRTSSLFNGITVTPFSLCAEEVTLAHTKLRNVTEFAGRR